jgi:hypothetical protein
MNRLTALRTALGAALCGALLCALALPAAAQAPKPTTPAAPTSPAAPRKMLPVDEGAADSSWVQFRSTLLELLQRGDRRALGNIIDPNILNPLEAPRGIATFRKLWDIDGKDTRLVDDLRAALQQGSAWYQPKKSPRLLCAPYVPIKWPLNDVDPYNSGAIMVKEALVKSEPSHASATLGTLSYDIIRVRDWEVGDKDEQLQQRWVKIRRADSGRDGYVPAEHIRSAIEYRACFAKTSAGWRLAEYVIGIEFLGGE